MKKLLPTLAIIAAFTAGTGVTIVVTQAANHTQDKSVTSDTGGFVSTPTSSPTPEATVVATPTVGNLSSTPLATDSPAPASTPEVTPTPSPTPKVLTRQDQINAYNALYPPVPNNGSTEITVH